MKKTWIVLVEQGVGHEYHDSISEAEFYGPFTKPQAESLAEKLNAFFEKHCATETGCHPQERMTASAMPLDHLTPRAILRHYREMFGS